MTPEIMQWADSLWARYRRHMAPVALEAHLRKSLSAPTEKEEWLSPQYSLRKVSGAQLSSYECFFLAEGWWQQGLTLLWGKENFTPHQEQKQQKYGRTMNNTSRSNLSNERSGRFCEFKEGVAEAQQNSGDRVSFAFQEMCRQVSMTWKDEVKQ